MISTLEELGPTWRAVRRMKRSQIIGRLRLRTLRFGVRMFGLDRLLPRRRRYLAPDWMDRCKKLGSPELTDASELWPEVSAIRFRGSNDWLMAGSGRNQRYERDFFPFELFFHDFVWQGTDSVTSSWEFLQAYLEDHRSRCRDHQNEWNAYAVSNRIASWLRFLARPSASESFERLAQECLVLTDFIEWSLERDLEANHLLKNLWALALSDALLSPDKRQIEASIRSYVEELTEQILPDGGHYELSPMYHAKVLSDARMIVPVLKAAVPETQQLDEIISKAEVWMDAMRMTPNRWANVNDSWTIPMLSDKIWENRKWIDDPSVIQLNESGFIRGAFSRWSWLIDVGTVGPAFNPGHSHSDTLSILLYHDSVPLIVDPGVLHYSPNYERKFLKSCHAHNGPCLRDFDHTEMIGSFRVGRAGKGAVKHVSETSDFQEVLASLEGYPEAELSRKIKCSPDFFEIVDSWSPRDGRLITSWSRFLWNGDITEINECTVDATVISFCFNPAQSSFRFNVEIRVSGCTHARLVVHESWYSDQFQKTLPGIETIVSGQNAGPLLEVRTLISIC